MEKSLTDLLDLPNLVVVAYGRVEASIYFQIEFTNSRINCSHCQSSTKEVNQIRTTLVRDLPISGQAVYLKVPHRQFYSYGSLIFIGVNKNINWG